MSQDQENQGSSFDPWTSKPAAQAETQTGIDDVRNAILDGADKTEEDKRLIGAFDPAVGDKNIEGLEPGKWKQDEWGLPPDCPVICLGTDDGAFYFLDTIGQMRVLKANEFGKGPLTALFMGRANYLYWAWPKRNQDGKITGWRPEKIAENLVDACARKGAWSPTNRVRGRGFWPDRKGNLILHCGDKLITNDDGEIGLGDYQGNIYPTRPPIERPWLSSLKGQSGPAKELLPHFKAWNWVRPEIDPVLLIGWIASGMMGGALKWRPECYILGDKGTGKSSLQTDIKQIFGDGIIQTGDTTAAGIYQDLQFDSLPVAIDEFEGKADARKQKAVIELARLSCSGAPMMRGGDNHKGHKFHGRSSFLFSSINPPPMDPQDLSRLAMLRLRPHDEGSTKPMIPDPRLREIGRQMMRRILDEWEHWPQIFERWRMFLAEQGHDGRGQDTFGTLMAAAEMIIGQDCQSHYKKGPDRSLKWACQV